VFPFVMAGTKKRVFGFPLKKPKMFAGRWWPPQGGGNPGTPAYVGMIGIILRRQKNTSRYLGITPLLVKLAYCLPPKKIWYDT
jgi:hypothetical protein